MWRSRFPIIANDRRLAVKKDLNIKRGPFLIQGQLFLGRGRRIKKVLPGNFSSSQPGLSTQILPLCALTMPAAMASPSPGPPPLNFVRPEECSSTLPTWNSFSKMTRFPDGAGPGCAAKVRWLTGAHVGTDSLRAGWHLVLSTLQVFVCAAPGWHYGIRMHLGCVVTWFVQTPQSAQRFYKYMCRIIAQFANGRTHED